MKQSKLDYLSPVTRTLVVRFEGVVCTSPVYGDPGTPGGGLGDGGEFTL